MKTGPYDEGTKRDVTFTILRQKKGPRAVASGGAWGLNSPPSPVFGQTVKPTSSRGGRLCLPQYYEPFQIFRPCDGPEELGEPKIF